MLERLISFFMSILGFGPAPAPQETLSSLANNWLYAITSEDFAGRRCATEGNAKARTYLLDEISKMGFHGETDSLVFAGDTLVNIIVRLVNNANTDTVIVVGAHYDGQFESRTDRHYPAANDNASGVVTLLCLMKRFCENTEQMRYPVVCCLWDGEEFTHDAAYKGSTHFVGHFDDPIVSYINIDTIGHDHDNDKTMSIMTRDDNPSWLWDYYVRDGRFKYRMMRAQKGQGQSDFNPFDGKDIPYIAFYDNTAASHQKCGHNIHSIYDTPDVVKIDRILSLSELIFTSFTK